MMSDSIQTPNCGACSMHHTPFCAACADHLRHDVEHLIADEASKLCFPSTLTNGTNEYEHLVELLTLRRAQRNGGAVGSPPIYAGGGNL